MFTVNEVMEAGREMFYNLDIDDPRYCMNIKEIVDWMEELIESIQ